jgi:two-component system NtrC family response regulator
MDFIYQSERMHELVVRARQFAATDAGVLITGECGVGKKTLARLIHDWSGRCDAPCVLVSCEDCASSEGTTTSKLQDRIASAAGGTLLLDDVAGLSESDQSALIAWLAGADDIELTSRPARPRCISTTRAPLAALAGADGLRIDLFHRLHVLHLDIPPLRARVDDVLALAEHFLMQIRQQHMIPAALSSDAIGRLQRHDWPGNVRELRNTLYRACFVSTRNAIGVEEIESSLVPAAVEAPQQFDQLKLADIERRVILRRLDRFHGNKARAAADLGVTDRTLRNKMREWREQGFVK